MPGRGEIEPYHNGVARDIRTVINTRVKFYTTNKVEWYKVRDGCEVEFELCPINTVKSEVARRMNRRVFVFPLSTPTSFRLPTFWVSWHETWLKKDSTNYILLNAGWTLFEGLLGNLDKTQVLRVDWDQLPHKGSKNAGHPHWHFDHELFIPVEPDTPGLVEVSTDDLFAMARGASVGCVHLAMGAWNKDMDHPKCWQRNYENDCQQLRDWCIKTLRYLKEQISGN